MGWRGVNRCASDSGRASVGACRSPFLAGSGRAWLWARRLVIRVVVRLPMSLVVVPAPAGTSRGDGIAPLERERNLLKPR